MSIVIVVFLTACDKPLTYGLLVLFCFSHIRMSWTEHVSRAKNGAEGVENRVSEIRHSGKCLNIQSLDRLKVCGVVLVQTMHFYRMYYTSHQKRHQNLLRTFWVILRTNNSLNQFQKSEPSWLWNHSRPIMKHSNIRWNLSK